MRPLARTVLAAALAAAALPAVAEQGQFSRTVFFGDSLSDAGYYRPVLIQSIGPSGGLVGQSTTNPGFVWAQHLAEHYGTNGAANGNGQTGDNYAVSGARVAVVLILRTFSLTRSAASAATSARPAAATAAA